VDSGLGGSGPCGLIEIKWNASRGLLLTLPNVQTLPPVMLIKKPEQYLLCVVRSGIMASGVIYNMTSPGQLNACFLPAKADTSVTGLTMLHRGLPSQFPGLTLPSRVYLPMRDS
jgi:hypothetical protein